MNLNTTLYREFYAVQNGRILLFTSATVRIQDVIRIFTSGNSDNRMNHVVHIESETIYNYASYPHTHPPTFSSLAGGTLAGRPFEDPQF